MRSSTLKLVLYVQLSAICFGQPRGHVQGYKMQSSDAFKLQNGSMKVSEPVRRCNHNNTNRQFKST
jgi:hypothetical protein